MWDCTDCGTQNLSSRTECGNCGRLAETNRKAKLGGAPSLHPLRDLVYVRQDPLPEKASGRELFIPDSTKKHEFTRYGTVLAVGPGKLNLETGARIPMAVRVGDRVMFADYWGDCVGLDTDPSLLIGPASGEEGLLAVIDP